jgi:GTPase involved in cell partitioning and DNA repair
VHWKAGNGGRGQGKSRTGASAPDIIIDVPPGTIVRTMEGTLAGQLVDHDQVCMYVCMSKNVSDGLFSLFGMIY